MYQELMKEIHEIQQNINNIMQRDNLDECDYDHLNMLHDEVGVLEDMLYDYE